MLRVLAWASTLAAAAAALPPGGLAEAEPRRPFVLPQWSATILYSGSIMGMNLTQGWGRYFYDSPNQRFRFNFSAGVNFFYPDGHMEEDRLYTNHTERADNGFLNFTVNGVNNGVCLPAKGSYTDPFTWIEGATMIGTRELGGRECSVWTRLVNKTEILGSMTFNMTACVAGDGLPLDLLVVAPGDGKFSGAEHFVFSDVQIGPPGDQTFENAKVCQSWPSAPCEDEGTSTLDVYRIFGPPEPQELTNRDAGDVMGDLSFICTQGSGHAYQEKLITHWRVKVSNAFGQYALCNFNGTANQCDGTPEMLRRVGRRSSQMQTHLPKGGQCAQNEQVGSQFSFPEAALCPPAEEPSSRGCAFAEPVAVKTIRASCLFFERGLLETCKADFGHVPYARSQLVWEAAFASEDPELGGCPHVELGKLSEGDLRGQQVPAGRTSREVFV